MVPGHRLVEAERLLVVKRAGLRTQRVDVVGRRPRTVVGRRLVESRWARRRTVILDGTRLDGTLGQAAERPWQRRLSAGQRRTIPLQQRVRGLAELLGTPVEPRAILFCARRSFGARDPLHLLLDRGEGLEAELVQLLRRLLRTRVVNDEPCVADVAARKRPQAGLRARLRQQLVGEEVAVAPQAGQHLLGDGRDDPVARRAALLLRQASEAFFVRQEDRGGGSSLEQVVERGDDPLHVDPGRGAVLEEAAPEAGDELIEIPAHLRVPRSQIGGAFLRAQRVVVRGLGDCDLRPVHLVDDPQRGGAGLHRIRVGELLPQHLDRDLLVG